MNNLDPEVAERPDDLIVYGGTGKAARNWEAFDAIVATLRSSRTTKRCSCNPGKPVGIFKTHDHAPRVLIANANLVPKWATWETFRELEDRGLTMYGQMTAGSWIYIGTQGILQGTYETLPRSPAAFQRLAERKDRRHRRPGRHGRRPAAGRDHERRRRAGRRRSIRRGSRSGGLDTRYLDESTADVDEALDAARAWRGRRRALDRRCSATPPRCLPALVARGFTPDVVTDQTSAHDPLVGYVPDGLSLADAARLRASIPDEYQRRSIDAMGRHVAAMRELQSAARSRSTTATTSARRRSRPASRDAFEIPGFVPEYIRPLFCEGKGPFRWVGAVRRSRRHRATDRAALEMFPARRGAVPLDSPGRRARAVPGLPARICWLGYGDRARFGLSLNELVRDGAVKAPIVIGRDHLDTGSVASPNRETEGMRDGSDAIADWPILNALLNASAGATWVSVHHGGGVGIGYSIHAGMVIVADGTREADERLARVLTCDPGTGVVRHADAGYPEAITTARQHGCGSPCRRRADDGSPRRPRTARARRARRDAAAHSRVIGGCGTGRTTLLHALADRMGRDQCQHIDVERAASTPERFHHAVRPRVAVHGQRPGRRRAGAGRARRAPRSIARWRCFTRARAARRAPATFLLDEVLELRTFESFPGLRHVCARCCTRWPRAATASC